MNATLVNCGHKNVLAKEIEGLVDIYNYSIYNWIQRTIFCIIDLYKIKRHGEILQGIFPSIIKWMMDMNYIYKIR